MKTNYQEQRKKERSTRTEFVELTKSVAIMGYGKFEKGERILVSPKVRKALLFNGNAKSVDGTDKELSKKEISKKPKDYDVNLVKLSRIKLN